MITYTITGGPALMRRLKAIGQTPKMLLDGVGIRTVREAKLIVPKRTGNLARTIRVGAHTAEFVEVRAGGVSKVGYAAAVEFGSRPHDIVPRNRKVLAWGGARTLGGRLRKGASAMHFARRVHHPGSKPHPFLRPAMVRAIKAVGLEALVKLWDAAA